MHLRDLPLPEDIKKSYPSRELAGNEKDSPENLRGKHKKSAATSLSRKEENQWPVVFLDSLDFVHSSEGVA